MNAATSETLHFLRLAAAGLPINFLGQGQALVALLLERHIEVVSETSTQLLARLSPSGQRLLLQLESPAGLRH
jgi:hypothetical protein